MAIPNESDARWASVEVTPAPLDHPAVAELLAALRGGNVNGGALFARFTVSDSLLRLFERQGEAAEARFFERLLALPAVRQALPELALGESLDADPQFEQTVALVLDGEIASALAGPAYSTAVVTPREAKALAARFCDALFGDRYRDVWVYHSREWWSPWFNDSGFDDSWLIIDKPGRSISLLCSTDSD